MDSRIIPPWAAVATIMPALGGPSSTTFHCSGEKAAFVVIRYSCPHCGKYGLLAGRGGGTDEREVPLEPAQHPPRSATSSLVEGARAPSDSTSATMSSASCSAICTNIGVLSSSADTVPPDQLSRSVRWFIT